MRYSRTGKWPGGWSGDSCAGTNSPRNPEAPRSKRVPASVEPCRCGCGRAVEYAGTGRRKLYATEGCRRDDQNRRDREEAADLALREATAKWLGGVSLYAPRCDPSELCRRLAEGFRDDRQPPPMGSLGLSDLELVRRWFAQMDLFR